jgi:GT2 family glycosyltransferase
MKEVSVIIVSFNGLLETTQPCLESIFEHAGGLDYEVIVVDNASQDATQDFLKRTAAAQPRLRWIGNRSNLGYAAANNLGLAAAQGECLVLLNSDTIVTAQSLAKLASFVRASPEVGLAGPVTNFAGNEQRIYTAPGAGAGILAQGLVWTANSRGDLFETERLGFFCVAMRRSHYERIGPFDERFGLGFFEDDDYCIRSTKAGFRLVCLEDAFVYHRGSQSFDQHPPADVRALMKKNQRTLEQKHGLIYQPLRSCERQLRLAKRYLSQTDEASRPRMLFKAANRLKMARACRPKSPAKRLWFHLRCLRVERAVERLEAKQGAVGPELVSPPDSPWMAQLSSSLAVSPEPQPASNSRMIKPLDASTYDTDKAKMTHYLRYYEQWFESLWDQPIALLELGIHKGGSMLLWRDYFTKGTIVGLDFNQVKLEDLTGRVHLYQGGQQDTALLDRIAAETAPKGFDIIIDDAAHVGELARISFWHLFDHHLKPGGLYIIEDWGTGYWETWPDGTCYKPAPEPGCRPKRRRGLSRLWRRSASIQKQDFPSHSSGMVGFVKQLVDECGMGDITFPGWGVGAPRESRFQRMHISHGQVMVQKRKLA